MEVAPAVVDAGGEEVREDVVGIGGNDEAAHRQAHALGVVAGEDVTEVAGGDAEGDLVPRTDGLAANELRVGVKVVADLRRETADVDGVGAREHHAALGEALGERAVREGALDLALAVVEGPVDGAHGHVAAKLGHHLEALDVGDLAGGVEHGDAHAIHAREAVERGLAGVSGGGGDDHDLLAVGPASNAHELGEHLERNVLEGTGGAMVELEQPVRAERGDGADRRGVPLASVGGVDAAGELLAAIVTQKRAQDEGGRLVVALRAHRLEREPGRSKLVGDVEAAVRSDSGEDCLLACYGIRFRARAVIERHGAPCVEAVSACASIIAAARGAKARRTHTGKIGRP